MSKKPSQFEAMLEKVDVLKDLDHATRQQISKRLKIDRFNQGEKLIESGHKASKFFIISSGSVELLTPNQLGHIKREIILKGVSMLGELALLTETPYFSDAVALEKTIVFYLDKIDFEYLLDRHESFASKMSELITERMAYDGGINKVGRYMLTRQIGEGNMATVFEGYDPVLEREVALKMLKYDLSHNQDFLKRFKQEARVIAKLDHPNIVRVFESINEYSTEFIVMERLQGQDVDQLLKQKGPLSIGETKSILYQVACALEYAHAQGEGGIIHRDIKPSNIFVDDTGQVKLTDFGIAKPASEEVTTILGTPKYLSPEIIQGQAFDGRSDIYSLGIMAFSILTGAPPFVADNLSDLLFQQVNKIPPDIKKLRPEIDNDLRLFIEKSLIKDPQQRISDFSVIKALLKPAPGHGIKLDDSDQVAFVTRIPNGSYQQAAKIINQLRKILEQEGIEHSFEVLK
jgi:tRNA A-37 threonylcarbamoyl transferase component Bud32